MPCGEWDTALSFFPVLSAFSKMCRKMKLISLSSTVVVLLFVLTELVICNRIFHLSQEYVCSFASLEKATPVQTQPGAREWAV